MEAIVPAFLLALLAQIVDRPAALTAMLADRYGRPLTVAVAALVAHGLLNGAAAVAGAAVAPTMSPHAQSLLLAIALLFGGVGAFGPTRLPARFERWRVGPWLTAFAGIFVLALAERTQFFTFALAARGAPWFAAIGATLAAFAVAFVAATLGESGWKGAGFRWLRIGSGVLFLIAGTWIGLGALGLL